MAGRMAQILVRQIEDDVKDALRRRAKAHGHSLEEEVRDILRDAAKPNATAAKGLGTQIADLFRGQDFPDIPDIGMGGWQIPDFRDDDR